MLTRRNLIGLGLGSVSSLALTPSQVLASESSQNKAINGESLAGEFDVCVLGGSGTGVFAAVRAAQAGMRVALVENNGFFGGMATAGLVPIWHSFYDTTGKVKIIKSLTEKISNKLIVAGKAKWAKHNDPSVGLTINVASLSLAFDELVSEHKSIRPFLHARVVGAKLSGKGRATHAIIEDKSGRRLIKAKFFIDATGDADFIRNAGLGVWRLPKADMQTHTTCMIVSGYTHACKRYRGKFSLSRILCGKGGAGLKHCFGWTAPIIGCPGLEMIAATRVPNCDPSDADDLTWGEMESRRQLAKIIDAANRLYPPKNGDPKIEIVAIAPMMGLRESCHIDSLYRISADDILKGKRFDDVIARGSYRVDIHEGDGLTFKYLNGKVERFYRDKNGYMKVKKSRWLPKGEAGARWYEIPYRSLVPKGSVNILAAGRMIDCERDAFGALRVMVNCNQMGEAAGLAAAKAVKENLAAADACVPLDNI
jgi:hypothetical protein